ncbi:hypothetical protein SJ322_06670 [Serratia marcescens]|uniref:hypothetical protein n=1 Tax=Serratia marcescens TaxID=615 RepID=UPI0029DCBD6E|nr:hypothetical protein [Serratia marcescens]MDX7271939.1 hypothetical protein [Serratia marcescens]
MSKIVLTQGQLKKLESVKEAVIRIEMTEYWMQLANQSSLANHYEEWPINLAK